LSSINDQNGRSFFFQIAMRWRQWVLAPDLKEGMVIGCKECIAGFLIAFGLGYVVSSFVSKSRKKKNKDELATRTDSVYSHQASVANNLVELIGNTPLLHLRSLSDETGCTILVCCYIFF